MATKNGTCANPIPLKNVSDAQVIVVTPREMRLEVSDVLGRGGQNYLIFVRMLGVEIGHFRGLLGHPRAIFLGVKRFQQTPPDVRYNVQPCSTNVQPI